MIIQFLSKAFCAPMPIQRAAVRLGVVAAAALALPAQAQQNAVLHWPISDAYVSPPVVNNLPDSLADDLAYVLAAWNQSPVLESAIVAGPTTGKACGPILGAIRFCQIDTGRPLAAGNQMYFTGDGHLFAVRALVSEGFISSPPYSSTEGTRAVLCYLLGYSYGAVPQDLDPGNADIVDPSGNESCMDATSTPEGNENPTPFDMAAIAELYSHTDTNFGIRDLSKSTRRPNFDQIAALTDLDSNFGKATRRNAAGRDLQFVRNLPDGSIMVTTLIDAD